MVRRWGERAGGVAFGVDRGEVAAPTPGPAFAAELHLADLGAVAWNAARLSMAADPGEILVTEGVRAALAHTHGFAPARAVRLGGGASGAVAHELLGLTDDASGEPAPRSGGQARAGAAPRLRGTTR
jgi:class 3 adenylate cyclase